MPTAPDSPGYVRVRRHSSLRPPRTAAIPVEGAPSEYAVAADWLAHSPGRCMECRAPTDDGVVERRHSQNRLVLEVWPTCDGCAERVEARAGAAALPPLVLRARCEHHPEQEGYVPCTACRARAFCDEACRTLSFFLRGRRGCSACAPL